MQFIKFVSLFTKNNFLQLRRKWRSLPLLLLFPIVLIGLVAFMFVAYFSNLEEEPIQIGLVDLEQSKETEMVIRLLEESSQLGNFLHMKRYSEEEAKQQIDSDELAAYILFPEEFTSKLYNGESVVVTIVGHPNKQMEGYFIKELVDSAARHISSSQANILTVNYFAKQLDIDLETRNQIVQEQFNEFLLYAIGKDNILDQNELSNNVSTSPKKYFGIATGFFVLIIWIFSIYQHLFKEQSKQIETRMMLYGVTELQQLTGRMIVTFIFSLILGIILFIGLINVLEIDLLQGNTNRLIILLAFLSLNYLFTLAILEIIFHSQKIRLLLQITITGIVLLTSGSIIPDIYLPMYIQDYLSYIFSFQVFLWLEEILLNGRVYVDYIPLLLSVGIGVFATVGIAMVKERVKP
ncbi:ABC transporter permease [Ornithinibacillus californiensis]|uniref:ABC transporter permease n=1 Tax=Ornithinibacillus californiensis TaxID=161536 RepID=UPI00064D8B01|nr:ABC transporter permease [Ornithinibacillus californiensis]